MKPVFGVDTTLDRKNEKSNAESFVYQSVSQERIERLDEVSQANMELVEKATLPLPLRIIQFISAGACIILLRIVLNFWTDDIALSELFIEAPGLFIIFVTCIAVFVALTIIGKKNNKEVVESDEFTDITNKTNLVSAEICAELGVSEDTPEVDIFFFKYKEKKGEIIPLQNSTFIVGFSNFAYKYYLNDQCLYLADLEAKYRIPFNNVKYIKTIKKRAEFNSFMWNKKEKINEGRYKQYRISENKNYGYISSKPYYVLCFEHNGEEWGIYFPCYELPVFEEITGLKAE